MKKIAWVLCIVLVASMLAGCTGGASSSSSTPSSSGEETSSSVPQSTSQPDVSSAAPSSVAPSVPDSSGTGVASPEAARYKQIVEDARDPELNGLQMYAVVTSPEDQQYELYFHESTGFKAEDMETYAISVGTIITLAYGVGIILPKDGQEQAVLDQVNGYILQQQKAQENYLHDQYEIAMAAIVKQAPTGEVLFAMCKDAEDVMAKMEAGLAA